MDEGFLFDRMQEWCYRRLRHLAGITSKRPVALVVSLAGTRIRPAVEAFCTGFAQPMPLYDVQRSGDLTQAEFPRVLFELQTLKNRLIDEGASEVHLFLSCSMAVACVCSSCKRTWTSSNG